MRHLRGISWDAEMACRLLSRSLKLLYCPARSFVGAVFYGGGLAESLRSTNYRWPNSTLLKMIGAGTQFRRVPPYFDQWFGKYTKSSRLKLLYELIIKQSS